MQGMKTVIAVAGLLAGAGFATGAVAQTVYKTVDDAGQRRRLPIVRRYSRSVEESPLDVMELQIRLTDPAARVAANRESAAEDARARDMVDSLTAEQDSGG